MREPFRSQHKEHSGEEGHSVGPGGAGGTCWSSQCKEKNLEPQKYQGVREDRGQRDESDNGVNSLWIPTESSGTFSKLTKREPQYAAQENWSVAELCIRVDAKENSTQEPEAEGTTGLSQPRASSGCGNR